MSDKQVWLVTGAGRGLGVDIAKAALAAGYAVVATARNTGSVTAALGDHDDLLAVALDVTDTVAAEAAVNAAVERFGHLDVLVNNAGSFKAGFFEEIDPEDWRAQIETTLFGPVNVTRAALPQMRAVSPNPSAASPTAARVGDDNARTHGHLWRDSDDTGPPRQRPAGKGHGAALPTRILRPLVTTCSRLGLPRRARPAGPSACRSEQDFLAFERPLSLRGHLSHGATAVGTAGHL
jgi:NAD(P)-dependent dehydrogenase (short-subunit alcohol dehydrogenase family)